MMWKDSNSQYDSLRCAALINCKVWIYKGTALALSKALRPQGATGPAAAQRASAGMNAGGQGWQHAEQGTKPTGA